MINECKMNTKSVCSNSYYNLGIILTNQSSVNIGDEIMIGIRDIVCMPTELILCQK